VQQPGKRDKAAGLIEIGCEIAGLQGFFDREGPLQFLNLGVVKRGTARRGRADKVDAQGIQPVLQAHPRSFGY